jgi:hypothetical protein
MAPMKSVAEVAMRRAIEVFMMDVLVIAAGFKADPIGRPVRHSGVPDSLKSGERNAA